MDTTNTLNTQAIGLYIWTGNPYGYEIAFIGLSGMLIFIETAFAIPVKLREIKGQ